VLSLSLDHDLQKQHRGAKKMTETAWIIVAIVIVVAIACVLLLALRLRRTEALRSRFGPEYDDAVDRYGSSLKAESSLVARQKRLEKLNIRSLQPAERDQFANQWQDTQSRFVDDPAASITQADHLVNELLLARGYPMEEFEDRAEDISVDHPHVVRNYRAAHAIAFRHTRGEAGTEDLRQALIHYRDLFDELLEAHGAGRRNLP
jgi:hypothetical protein